jgi:hypothetical protein
MANRPAEAGEYAPLNSRSFQAGSSRQAQARALLA